MLNNIEKRLFTRQEYHLMGKAGVFGHSEKIELINGGIFKKHKERPLHANICRRLNFLFFRLLGDRVVISCKNPVAIDEYSEPEPDVALIKQPLSKYELHHPKGDDVFLTIEVADSSLKYDQEIKLPLYASVHIPECWIVNLETEIVEQYNEPSNGIYKLKRILRRGDLIKLEAFDISIAVSDILGK